MSERILHLAAYDVTDDRRLVAALHIVRAYATGGQKSAYEVFLSPAEKGQLLLEMAQLLDEREDRFLLVRLDPRARVYTLGVANEPVDPPYFYVA